MFLYDPKSGAEVEPAYPVAGTHLVKVARGDVVEVVVQNNAANAFNGDLRPAGAGRVAQEQHPFHLHGHHFWLLGGGAGNYTEEAAAAAGLNTVNPPLRDTATLGRGAFIVFRFVADNPGTWL